MWLKYHTDLSFEVLFFLIKYCNRLILNTNKYSKIGTIKIIII